MLDALLGLLQGLLQLLGGLLPASPFGEWATVTEGMRLGIGYLNWVIPLADMLAIFALWLALGVAVSIARFILVEIRGLSPTKAVTG